MIAMSFVCLLFSLSELQNKKYKKVEGAEKEERGVDESDKLQYNKAFILKADRAESMLDKMFS
jgi:hypothetical protein